MRTWPLRLAVMIAVVGVLSATASLATAATGKLESKPIKSARMSYPPRSVNWLYQLSGGRYVQMNLIHKRVTEDGKSRMVKEERKDDSRLKKFAKAVTKELEKYNSKLPFRGTIKLGDKNYGFVFDSVAPGVQGYGLLYFDLNGNGDLTDDEVIKSDVAKRYYRLAKDLAKLEKADKAADDDEEDEDAAKKRKKQIQACRNTIAQLDNSFRYVDFPRVELAIEVDGEKVDYGFFTRAYDFSEPYARFAPAIYYEGDIELDGKRRHVVLTDFNTNGRFDDPTTVPKVNGKRRSPRPLYANRGDQLYVDPVMVYDYSLGYDRTGPSFRYNVGKLVCLDGQYYDMNVAPSGKSITLEPADVALGHMENPSENYAALVFGDLGVIKVQGTPDRPAALPAGKWTLLCYMIDLTDVDQKSPSKEESDKKKSKAKKKPRPKSTFASAVATTATKPFEVVEGQTVAVPFGAPYKATVELSYYRRNRDDLYLGLEIVGTAGEELSNMSIEGNRPKKPKFKIMLPNGEIVKKGNFEYG